MADDVVSRLSDQLLAGDLVFYVGAGFSIDSEGNTAARLINRLILRLFALVAVLEKHSNLSKDHRKRVRDIRKDFALVFNFEESVLSQNAFKWDSLSTLAGRYYEVNDWICSAFSSLMEIIVAVEEESAEPSLATLVDEISEQEREWVNFLKLSGNPVPMTPITPALVTWAKEVGQGTDKPIGKALFLDAQGFYKVPEIMGGEAEHEDEDEVRRSYHGKLFDRHWVMARFAREGWANSLITTNFDRLLEGAYRLSGFRSYQLEGVSPENPERLPYAAWRTIASPVDFCEAGGAQRIVQLVKIHGCAKRYETLRQRIEKGKATEADRQYLRSMVFTFREIQNWREDGWSRDMLRTLLRTKRMVFCCYSLQDPVIHDTMRSVYEEMGRQKARLTETGGSSNRSQDGAAYYLSSIDKGQIQQEFHSSEVLRAASLAATGEDFPIGGKHPNEIGYHFRNKGDYPHLDDFFLELNHLTYRQRQLEYLESELRPIAYHLIRKVHPLKIERIVSGFKSQIENEAKELESLRRGAGRSARLKRRKAAQITGWSFFFHPALLKELACIDAVIRGGGRPSAMDNLRENETYYYPMAARPGWAAWSVVVELAVRRMVECTFGVSAEPRVRAACEGMPAVAVYSPDCSLPLLLSIWYSRFDRVGKQKRHSVRYRRYIYWMINGREVPWPMELDGKDSVRARRKRGISGELNLPAPQAKDLIDWAAGGRDDTMMKRCLGVE